jgi:hypothetical protein
VKFFVEPVREEDDDSHQEQRTEDGNDEREGDGFGLLSGLQRTDDVELVAAILRAHLPVLFDADDCAVEVDGADLEDGVGAPLPHILYVIHASKGQRFELQDRTAVVALR